MRTLLSIVTGLTLLIGTLELSEAFYLSSERTRLLLDRQEIERMRAENDEDEQLQQNSEELEKALEEAAQSYRALKPLLPEEAELPRVFDWIATRAVERGLKLEHFSQGSRLVDRGIIREIPMQVEVLGYYDAVERFLEDFSRFERVLMVNGVKMTQEQQQQPLLTVRASINVSAFVGK